MAEKLNDTKLHVLKPTVKNRHHVEIKWDL